MNIAKIADRLVELCRKSDFETAQRELFAENARSIEPYETPEFAKETVGLQAIIDKGAKFQAMVDEIHSIKVSQPLLAGNSFAATMSMDMTMRGKGRMEMTELCVYLVKDGKIVSEEFFT